MEDLIDKNSDQDKGKKGRKVRQTPDSLQKFRSVVARAQEGAGADKVAAQKAKGKLTARERITYLLDENTFHEIGSLAVTRCTDFGLKDKAILGDGVITGFGKINGRDVAVFSEDFTQLGGSLGLTHATKIAALMDKAIASRCPMIGILDSGGARIQEGVDSLDGYGHIFRRNVEASGVIPQISIILGPCAGGAVYSPALTDFTFMVEGISHMFVTGPDVVKAATGEQVDFDTPGGSEPHSSKSGVCHFVAKSEPDCFRQVRELMSFLPQSRFDRPPMGDSYDPVDRPVPLLEKICGINPRKSYRMHHIIWWLADEHKFFEVHQNFAKNATVGFIRLGGEVVGVIGNNPAHMAGALDIHSSDKIARFIRFLNCFNIPVLSLIDVGGYWPGVEQEHGGIIRHGAKIIFAYSEASVPKISLILRKAYGGAYIAMNSKYLGSDFNFALPSAEIAVMGPRGAVEILYRKDIKNAPDDQKEAAREKLSQEYADKFASPYQTASTGSIDEVLEPCTVRHRLIQAFRLLRNKRVPGQSTPRGNIPL
ncbi:MAG: acyl-CoA carboxylase subunit beta [Elusimicrobia bacterium]|nr:acyl-CoA carboxylase subunit beta [Elusimicrobiota bacterium]